MRYLPLLCLLGCASLKPLPQQTLNCFKAEATPANAAKAAICIAQGVTVSQIESCAEGVGLDVLECEGLALWSDLNHAKTVGTTALVATATVQSNATSYLMSKGVIVKAPTNPTP
jgi:hypothetical protein